MKHLSDLPAYIRQALAPLPAYHILNVSIGRTVWRPRIIDYYFY